MKLLNKIKEKTKRILWLLKNINIQLYIKLNYFSKNTQRDRHVYFYPYKYTIIKAVKSAAIELHAEYHFGINAISEYRTESCFIAGSDAHLVITNPCYLLQSVYPHKGMIP